jgi:hypothetical protein
MYKISCFLSISPLHKMPHLQIAGKLALALLNGSNIKVYFYVVVGSSAAES